MRTHEQGFTLMEAMVALAIVSMVVLSYLGIRTSALMDATEARNWRLARELAEEKLSELRAGAREVRPENGAEVPFDQYPGFRYRILIGESAISSAESELASLAAGEDEVAQGRAEWQQNRDIYRKASNEGLSFYEYQDKVAQEQTDRELAEKTPDELQFEDVAVMVLFPKTSLEEEGDDHFLLKDRLSTLALSGMTPEQAELIAKSRGEGATGDAAAGAPASAGTAGGGAGAGTGNPVDQGTNKGATR
jgi:prepilin-type N-terminal cleavage/methylation domain-containing protein